MHNGKSTQSLRWVQQAIGLLVLCIVLASGYLAAMRLYNWDSEAYQEVLSSDWDFYREQLLVGHDDELHSISVDMPVEFDQVTGRASGYGTFVKEVTIPEAYVGKQLAINLPYVYGAARLYVNGEETFELGRVGTSKETHQASSKSAFVPLKVERPDVTIAVQLSSFEMMRGGFSASPIIGEYEYLLRMGHFERYINVFCIGIIFIAGITTALIGILRRQEFNYLVFGLFCLFVSVRAIFTVPYLYHDLPFTIPYVAASRIEYFTSSVAIALYATFICLLFKRYYSKVFLYVCLGILAGLGLLSLFARPALFIPAFLNMFPFYLGLSAYCISVIFKAMVSGAKMAKTILVGIFVVMGGMIIDMLNAIQPTPFPQLVLMSITLNVVMVLYSLGKNYAQQVLAITHLYNQLASINRTLDEKVKERTAELVQANLKLSELAEKDALTGVYNRHKFNILLEEHFSEAMNHGKQLSMMMMDVDEFKKYNDHHGHVEGDHLLRSIAQLISNLIPEGVIFARYGGEEFVWLLPGYSKQEAYLLGDRIRQRVREAKMGKNEPGVSISLGVAELTADQPVSKAMDLVEIADKRLYKSKLKGRNTITLD
mgnify:CR=1 FL=1